MPFWRAAMSSRPQKTVLPPVTSPTCQWTEAYLAHRGQTCGPEKKEEEAGVDSIEGDGEEGRENTNVKCHQRLPWRGSFFCLKYREVVLKSIHLYAMVCILIDNYWPTLKPNTLLLIHTLHFSDGFECSIPCLKWRRQKKKKSHSLLPGPGSPPPAQCSLACLQGAAGPRFLCWSQHILPTQPCTFHRKNSRFPSYLSLPILPAHSPCTQIWDSQQVIYRYDKLVRAKRAVPEVYVGNQIQCL